LRQDDVVTIPYNSSDYGYLTVNGRINEHRLSADLIALPLCASCVPIAFGAYLAMTLRRMRRTLKSTKWRREPVMATRYNSRWSKDRWALQLANSAPLLSANYTFWCFQDTSMMVEVAGQPVDGQ
jgi:hypothetical protein